MFHALTRTITTIDTHSVLDWSQTKLGTDRFNNLVAEHGTIVDCLFNAYGVLLASADHVLSLRNFNSPIEQVDQLVHAKFEHSAFAEIPLKEGATIMVMHESMIRMSNQASIDVHQYAYHVRIGEKSNVVTYGSTRSDKILTKDDLFFVGRAVAGATELSVTRERVFDQKFPSAFGEFAEWYNLPYNAETGLIDLTKLPLYTAVEKQVHSTPEPQIVPTVVYAISDEKFSSHMADAKMVISGGKTKKLNEVMGLAITTTDYVLDIDGDLRAKGIRYANDTGYYDPLAKMFFAAEDGTPLKAGATISGIDLKTKRRLHISVIEPGRNVIVHDRYSVGKEKTVLVATEPRGSVRGLIGMSPAWAEGNIHDLAMAAKYFGFEFDRGFDSVYIPTHRHSINPTIKLMANLFK